MTLRRLEIFVVVVEAGGFRACSEQLDISPAAVSHQVNQLEEEIGYALFLRRRGRVCNLTEQGAKAYREAKDLLGHADSFESLLGGMNNKSTRRLAVFADPILDTHLAKHITAFVAEHPSIEVVLQRSHFEEMVEALGSGRADIAYFYSAGPVSRLPSALAWSEPLSICAKCEHPVFTKQGLTWRDLRSIPFVAPPVGTHFRRSVDSLFRRYDLQDYNIVLESGNANIAREAVIGGFAMSAVITRYLNEDLSRSGVRAIPEFEGKLALDVRRALRSDLALDRTALALTRCLNKAAPSTGPARTDSSDMHRRLSARSSAGRLEGMPPRRAIAGIIID
jgi:DNA-binding transcriptional LysR family regulator